MRNPRTLLALLFPLIGAPGSLSFTSQPWRSTTRRATNKPHSKPAHHHHQGIIHHHASLSTTPTNSEESTDITSKKLSLEDVNHSNNNNQQNKPTNVVPLVSNKANDRRQFRQYLRIMSHRHRITNPKTLANRMDDELKQMEIQYFDLDPQQGSILEVRYPESVCYSGPIVEPDVSCYAMVANAYARSGMGKRAAQLAEQVLERWESHSSAEANAILKTACLNAATHCDDWERADYWIENMEQQFAHTRHKKDAPDTITYTQYLEGLSSSKTLSPKEIQERCEKTLMRMQDQYDHQNNPWTKPNRYTYIAAMKCRAKQYLDVTNNRTGIEVVLQDVDSLFREMEAEFEATKDPRVKPNGNCYVVIANAAARCRGGMEAAKFIERLLLEMEHKFAKSNNDPDYIPLDGMYTACFSAFARVEPQRSVEASQTVIRMISELEHSKTRLSVHAYTAAINGILVHNTPENRDIAEDILGRMAEFDSVAYQCVIRAHAKDGNAAKAEKLLWELQAHAAEQSDGATPSDIVAVAACINAWCLGYVQDFDKTLKHAEKLLELFTTKVKSVHRQVDARAFENVMRVWSISKRRDAGEKVEKWIGVMQELSETVSDRFQPNYNHYMLALDAWATSNRPDAAKPVSLLVEKMDLLAQEGKMQPLNNRALSSALVSIKRSHSPWAISLTQELFQRIIDRYSKGDKSTSINSKTSVSVFAALAKSNDNNAPKQAIDLLHQIRGLGKADGTNDFGLNTIAYNCVLNLLAKRGLADEADKLLAEMIDLSAKGDPCAPDTVSYSCVCRAYANSKTELGMKERTLSILAEVEEKYRDGNSKLKPDIYLFNSVLDTLAKASRKDDTAAQKADDILRRMELSTASDCPVPPDLLSFSSVCQAWAVSSAPNSTKKAFEILHRVESEAEQGSLSKPEGIFYSAVAIAFARNRNPKMHNATQIVKTMENFHESGRKYMRPSTQTYNFLLSGWTKSQNPIKAKKASALLRSMKGRAARRNYGPDVFSYNCVILAASRTKVGSPTVAKEIFQLAVDAFRELHDKSRCSASPNSFTYSYFLQACNALLPACDDREKLMSKAFHLCKDDGLVSEEVLVDASAMLPDILKGSLEQEGIFLTDPSSNDLVLPASWTENLPDGSRVAS